MSRFNTAIQKSKEHLRLQASHGGIMRKFLLLFFAGVFLFATHAYSVTSNKIKYQGILRKQGQFITGNKQVKFRIVDSADPALETVEYWTSG
jgi:hypothetical protein